MLFEEEGALSHIIKEVATGLSGKQQISEVKTFKPPKQNNQQMIQRKKKLLDAIGKDAYNGVNVFEGTTAAPAAMNESQAQGPLSGVAPNDPGVDISSIFSAKSFTIGQKMMGNE